MQHRTWWNVFNYKEHPATQYGFAVDENGICVAANDKVSGWMIGKNIEWIKKFYEDKPVDLSEIKINDNEAD